MVYSEDVMDKVKVVITRMAQKQILRVPIELIEVIQKWVLTVETIGIENTRKQGGKGLSKNNISSKN